MEEKPLVWFSLILSATGLLALFLLAHTTTINTTPIADISPDDVGRGLKVCGDVNEKYTSKNNHTFFSLTDETGTIQTVVFNTTKISISQPTLCVTGRIDLYQGKLEIIAREVMNV